MGTSTTIIAGIGVVIDLAKFDRPKAKLPSCEHADRIGQTFCPVCGTRVGEQTDYSDRTPADELYALFHEEPFELPVGFIIQKVGYDDQRWFIGFGETFDRQDTDGASFLLSRIPSPSYVQDALLNLLEQVKNAADFDVPDDLFNGEAAFIAIPFIH